MLSPANGRLLLDHPQKPAARFQAAVPKHTCCLLSHSLRIFHSGAGFLPALHLWKPGSDFPAFHMALQMRTTTGLYCPKDGAVCPIPFSGHRSHLLRVTAAVEDSVTFQSLPTPRYSTCCRPCLRNSWPRALYSCPSAPFWPNPCQKGILEGTHPRMGLRAIVDQIHVSGTLLAFTIKETREWAVQGWLGAIRLSQ